MNITIVLLAIGLTLAISLYIIAMIRKKSVKFSDKDLRIIYEEEQLLHSVKRAIFFYYEEEFLNLQSLGITDIKVDDGECVVVTITLQRPGVLIGKAGRNIDALKEHIIKRIGRDARIHIVEDKMWDWNSIKELPPFDELN